MKRSVLSICFLLALTLSSLCLLSNKISPVYGSSEQILNGSFEDYSHPYGLNYTFEHWTNSYEGWYAEEGSPHSGDTNLWAYSSNAEIMQEFPVPINVSTVSAFGFWARGEDDSGGIRVKMTCGLDWDEGYEGYSNVYHNFGSNHSEWYYIDLISDASGFTGILDLMIEYHNSYYFGEIDDVTLIGDPIEGSSSSVSLSIQGDPELNYDFLMNGSAYTTPYSNSNFTSGNITLENSSPSLTVGHFIYTFSYWSINATLNLTSSSFTVDIEGNTMISLVFSKAIMDIAFDPRNVASEIVHLADTGSQLGRMLGVNSFIGGLIMSAIICAIFLFPVMIFKRTLLPMAIMGFLGLAISTGLGFLPFWIDLVLLLIISILFSGKIRDAITGAGH